MEYEITRIVLKENEGESDHRDSSTNQCITIEIVSPRFPFPKKNIKVFENQPLFFELKKIFSDIASNDEREKKS